MQNKNPTPHHDINIVINYFLNHIKEILGPNFVGMYLYGSLATGDFDKNIRHMGSSLDI
jgi:predicted nucleotidyltransferase